MRSSSTNIRRRSQRSKSRHDASIAALASAESARSIQAGVTWGQSVADNIWAWRLTDGTAPPPPPFLGVLGIVGTSAAVGVWRPTPLLNASGVATQFATMTPWVMQRPSQFRLPPPLALTSAEYAADYTRSRSWALSLDRDDQRTSQSWHFFGRETRRCSGIGLPHRFQSTGL